MENVIFEQEVVLSVIWGVFKIEFQKVRAKKTVFDRKFYDVAPYLRNSFHFCYVFVF